MLENLILKKVQLEAVIKDSHGELAEAFLLEIPFLVELPAIPPIPHSSVINKIREEADKNNLIVSSTNYSTAKLVNVISKLIFNFLCR